MQITPAKHRTKAVQFVDFASLKAIVRKDFLFGVSITGTLSLQKPTIQSTYFIIKGITKRKNQ